MTSLKNFNDGRHQDPETVLRILFTRILDEVIDHVEKDLKQ